MNDRDYWTIEAMERFGGSFFRQLAIAARHADALNLELIKQTWPKRWSAYEKMGKKLEKTHNENAKDF